MSKQEVKEIRKLLYQVISRLEKVAPGLSSVKITDKYTETGTSIIESWIPRGQFMIKKLDKIIDELPKGPRAKKSLAPEVNTYILKGWTLTKNPPEADLQNLSNWITLDDYIEKQSPESKERINKRVKAISEMTAEDDKNYGLNEASRAAIAEADELIRMHRDRDNPPGKKRGRKKK